MPDHEPVPETEILFDLAETLRLVREVHGLEAHLQTMGSGVTSIWVHPVIEGMPLAMAGPGATRAEGVTARAVDVTIVQDDEEDPPDGTAADMGLATEADLAARIARFVADHPHHRALPDPDAPSYTEMAPLGPTRAEGDSAGPWQMSVAYVRRFTRPVLTGPDTGNHLVIDVECYAANAAPDPEHDPAEPALSRTWGYTVCADPADPGGTEIISYNSHDPDIAGQEAFTDMDAYRYCAEVDPATLTWDGRPDPAHPTTAEARRS